MLVKCALSGEVLEGTGTPPPETPMHLMVYRGALRCPRRGPCPSPYGHRLRRLPPSAGGAVPHRDRQRPGGGAGGPFALPSTREVPDSVRPFVRDHSAVLLANHGPWPGAGSLVCL